MQTFNFGEWEIEADVEATQAYYQQFDDKDADNQAYRNYKEFCKTLTEVEEAFFDSLGIRPDAVSHFFTLGIEKDGKLFTSGLYHVLGKFNKTPERLYIPVEEFIENDCVDDRPDPTICIGRFRLMPNSLEEEIRYECLPVKLKGLVVQLYFTIESTPWLLEEECAEKRYYPPKWWEIGKKIAQIKKWKIADAELLASIESQVLSIIEPCSWKKLSDEETNQLCKRWFYEFLEKDRQKEARKACFGTRKYGGHLWHAFSYEFLSCSKQEAAKALFDAADKSGSIFVLLEQIIDKQHLAYCVEDPIHLKAVNFDELNDVYVIGKDFSFTYVHTHEEFCGPYFYKK